ncbi:beta-1,3-galactosyltransferase 5-like [Pectinophora gossypiella]|uniref:beta-1,3-galactosyltransferase 5-like n=1 Tax=Pectinophora gossypiella TaxID=13191 RepID=UPI00214DF2E4|nr:beta-1,3-galactosyltransferase 5-like [Pectinophora gossypiella]
MVESQNSDKFEMLNILKVVLIILSLLLVYNYHKSPPIVVRIQHPKFTLLGPYNTTEYEVDDVYDQLIDIKNFTFKVNPQPCTGYTYGLLLVVIVASKPNNFDKRTIIRETWGRSTDSTKVVFLLGDPGNLTLARKIDNESLTYGDIVQGNFIDAYRNMTYKHVMGLKWVAYHCPTAKYILKTDDDVLVNSHELRKFLGRELSPWGAQDLITCSVLRHAIVQRSSSSKWMVSEAEYTGKYYPTYCAGWAVLYSQDVIPRLLTVAQNIPYFWIDDVHITGVAAEKIMVDRTPLLSLILSSRRVKLLTSMGPEYAGQFLFGPPDLSTDKITEIWKAIPE